MYHGGVHRGAVELEGEHMPGLGNRRAGGIHKRRCNHSRSSLARACRRAFFPSSPARSLRSNFPSHSLAPPGSSFTPPASHRHS